MYWISVASKKRLRSSLSFCRQILKPYFLRIVRAGSVVTKDVPAYTLVAGNPARVIRELREEEVSLSSMTRRDFTLTE